MPLRTKTVEAGPDHAELPRPTLQRPQYNYQTCRDNRVSRRKRKKDQKKVCTTSPIEQHLLIVKIVHIDNVKELTTAASAAAAGALVS